MTPALALVQQQTIGLNQQALEEFIEHRRELKKPLTPLALKKTTNLMLKYPEAQQQVMVDAAIMSGWRAIFPVDPLKQQSTRQADIYTELSDTSWAT